jgi:2',3'-cyclic-nucleotide 2'-phosphodiesterase (5'-nucleotidase family)
MASWFGAVLALLAFANGVGLAILALGWVRLPAALGGRPLPTPPVLDRRQFLPFVLSLLLLAVAWLCRRSMRTWPPSVWATLGANVALAVAAILTLSGLALGAWPAGPLGAGAPRTESIVILAVNDVYRIEGLDGGKIGGLARLRTLRAQLERAHPGRVLFLHGGDAIFPSFPSRKYKGKQMIAALNLMDGDPQPGRLDERMFVVFGNHEFDDERCAHDSASQQPAAESTLQQRVAESDFSWLHSNTSLTPCTDDMRPRLVGANLLHSKTVEVGRLKVGLFGLTIPTVRDNLGFHFLDAQETARALVADLRKRGADVVVAVTHLRWADDLRLYGALRDVGLDLIIGGHDHVQMKLPKDAAEPRIFKADADAATAWVITLTRAVDGRVKVTGELRKLDSALAKDPLVDGQVDRWMKAHDAEFCKEAATDPKWVGAKPDPVKCLDTRLGVTDTPLVASEERIRSSETSLGNWVADEMFAAFKDCGVDGAFINAGALRLNRDLPAGAEITRRHLEELMQFPTDLRVYKLTHQQLRAALQNAVSQPEAGRWLQVSDQIAFTYRPRKGGGPGEILNVAVRPPASPSKQVTASSSGTLRIVATEFLQKDPFDEFHKILPEPEKDPCGASNKDVKDKDLKELLYASLQKQGRIKPEEQGRICTEDDSRRRPCRADQWVKSP